MNDTTFDAIRTRLDALPSDKQCLVLYSLIGRARVLCDPLWRFIPSEKRKARALANELLPLLTSAIDDVAPEIRAEAEAETARFCDEQRLTETDVDRMAEADAERHAEGRIPHYHDLPLAVNFHD